MCPADEIDEEGARRLALQNAQFTLSALVVNLIRVVRGAGKPELVTDQVIAFLQAMQAHWDKVERYPTAYDLAEPIGFQHPYLDRVKLDDGEYLRAIAEEKIMRASLQYVASTLAGQSTQQSVAHGDFYDGVNRLTEVRAEIRRKWEAELKASRPARKPARSPKPKTPS